MHPIVTGEAQFLKDYHYIQGAAPDNEFGSIILGLCPSYVGRDSRRNHLIYDPYAGESRHYHYGIRAIILYLLLLHSPPLSSGGHSLPL